MKLAALFIATYVCYCYAGDAVVWNVQPRESDAFQDSFHDILDKSTQQRPLLCLLVEQFSLADFSRLIDAYGSGANRPKWSAIKQSLENTNSRASRYLADGIESGLGSVSDEKLLRYQGPKDNEQLMVVPVVVVEGASLEQLDKKLAQLLPIIQSRNFQVVLTDKNGKPDNIVRRKRQAAGETTEATLLNGTNCLLYIEGVEVGVLQQGRYATVAFNTSAATEPKCDKKSAEFTLTYDQSVTAGGVTMSNLELKLGFSLSTATGYWKLTSLNVTSLKTSSGDVENVNLGARNLALTSVPTFSYACSRTRNLGFQTKSNVQGRLALIGLQVQVFSSGSIEKFTDNVDDCVPFFTIGTWMGIFSGLLLLVIFFFGMSMIANLQTMDRFDDPKGKPLHINVKE